VVIEPVDGVSGAGPFQVRLPRCPDQLIARVVDLGEVRAAVAALPRCRGSRLAREVAALADGRAASPQETRVRLFLHAGDPPMPVAQFDGRDRGGLVARSTSPGGGCSSSPLRTCTSPRG
jgi:hypothetical protein